MGKIKDFLNRALWQDPQYEENQVNCPEITIEGIDGDLYRKLLAEANAAGAKFDGSKVSISGLEFDWNYDLEAQVLHVTCTKKEFFIRCPQVESKIRELVEKSKGSI
jgi:hypothetical protein